MLKRLPGTRQATNWYPLPPVATSLQTVYLLRNAVVPVVVLASVIFVLRPSIPFGDGSRGRIKLYRRCVRVRAGCQAFVRGVVVADDAGLHVAPGNGLEAHGESIRGVAVSPTLFWR